jgi:hypothetical protein
MFFSSDRASCARHATIDTEFIYYYPGRMIIQRRRGGRVMQEPRMLTNAAMKTALAK